MREEDRSAFDELKVGDVLLGNEITSTKPSGEMFHAQSGRWFKITFEPEAAFLVVHADDQEETNQVYAHLVILGTGDRVEMVIDKDALCDTITVLRGRRVLSAEEHGTVGR